MHENLRSETRITTKEKRTEYDMSERRTRAANSENSALCDMWARFIVHLGSTSVNNSRNLQLVHSAQNILDTMLRCPIALSSMHEVVELCPGIAPSINNSSGSTNNNNNKNPSPSEAAEVWSALLRLWATFRQTLPAGGAAQREQQRQLQQRQPVVFDGVAMNQGAAEKKPVVSKLAATAAATKEAAKQTSAATKKPQDDDLLAIVIEEDVSPIKRLDASASSSKRKNRKDHPTGTLVLDDDDDPFNFKTNCSQQSAEELVHLSVSQRQDYQQQPQRHQDDHGDDDEDDDDDLMLPTQEHIGGGGGGRAGRSNNAHNMNNINRSSSSSSAIIDNNSKQKPRSSNGPREQREYPAAWNLLTNRFGKNDLEMVCEFNGLNTGGSKEEMVSRILSAFADDHASRAQLQIVSSPPAVAAHQLALQRNDCASPQRVSTISQTEHVTRCATECVNMLQGSSVEPASATQQEVQARTKPQQQQQQQRPLQLPNSQKQKMLAASGASQSQRSAEVFVVDDDDEKVKVDEKEKKKQRELPARRQRIDDDNANSNSNKHPLSVEERGETASVSIGIAAAQSISSTGTTLKQRSLDSLLAQADSVLLKHGYQQQQQPQLLTKLKVRNSINIQTGQRENADGFSIPESPLLMMGSKSNNSNGPVVVGAHSQRKLPPPPTERVSVASYLNRPQQPNVPALTRSAALVGGGGGGGNAGAAPCVFLIVDTREPDKFVEHFVELRCAAVQEALPVGDFALLYAPPQLAESAADVPKSFMIPLLIERKQKSDMEKSIEDHRLTVQRWHLRRSVTCRRILLAEEMDLLAAAHRGNLGSNNAAGGTGFQHRYQPGGDNRAFFAHKAQQKSRQHHGAIMSTAALSASFSTALGGVESPVPEGDTTLRVVMTKDLAETARFLSALTQSLDELLAPCGGNVDLAEAALQALFLGEDGRAWSSAAAANFWGRKQQHQLQAQQQHQKQQTTSALLQRSRINSAAQQQNVQHFADLAFLQRSEDDAAASFPLPILCSKESWFRAHAEFREFVQKSSVLPRMLGTLRGVSPGIGINISRSFPSPLRLFASFADAEREAAALVAAQRRDHQQQRQQPAKKKSSAPDLRLEPASILYDAVREGRGAGATLVSMSTNNSSSNCNNSSQMMLFDDPELSALLGNVSASTTSNKKQKGKLPKAPKTTETQKTLSIALKNIFRNQDYNT